MPPDIPNAKSSLPSAPDGTAELQAELNNWLRTNEAELVSSIVNRFCVLPDCTSTQDECMTRVNRKPGLCVIALHQTQGRGRLGRKWNDERGQCASFTLSLAIDPSAERMSAQTGLAVCIAAEHLLENPNVNAGNPKPEIRWPNDIIVNWRKLAGILIESRDGVAYVGIGMNISQQNWPADLANKAVSLRECGAKTLGHQFIIRTILTALSEVLTWTDQRLTIEYESRNALLNHRCTFESAKKQFTGVVTDLDPFRGLTIGTDASGSDRNENRPSVHLTAATTSLLEIHKSQDQQ